MRILNTNSKRFEVALELFMKGESITLDNTNFYLNKENKTLEIRKISEWSIQNLNEQRASEQFNKSREIFNQLLNEKRFTEIIANYSIRFSLIQDNGNSSVEICYLSNNKVIWK